MATVTPAARADASNRSTALATGPPPSPVYRCLGTAELLGQLLQRFPGVLERVFLAEPLHQTVDPDSRRIHGCLPAQHDGRDPHLLGCPKHSRRRLPA